MLKPRKKRIRNVEIDESVINFFFYGEKPEQNTQAWDIYIERHFDRDSIKRAWLQHRDALLQEWKKRKGSGLPWGAIRFDGA